MSIDPERAAAIVLRPLRPADTDDVVAACADPLTQRFLPALPNPYTPTDARSWIANSAPRAVAGGGGTFAVADPRTDRLLGAVAFRPQPEAAAEMGYWVAPWARHRGVATAAARALARHVFADGVERLTLRTDPANAASQRVAINAGFTHEGVQRGGGRARSGARADRIVWARLHTDSDQPSRRLLPDLPGRHFDDQGLHPGELTDGVIVLRPLGPQDAADTYALRALPEVIATNVPPTVPDPARIALTCAWAESGWLTGARADFTVRDAETDAYAGDIGLYYWEPPTQQAMIGYSMVREWRGRGYATRAAKLVAGWAFAHTDILRVIAGTAPENTGSQRVLEGAGFLQEGYQRSRLPGVAGRRIDDLLYALLPSTTGDRLSTP